MSQLSNLTGFQGFQLKKWRDQIKKNPEQLAIGAADPFGAKVWGKITGKDYEPMVTQMGGSTEKTEGEANDAGINSQSHNNVDSLAKALSAFFTGKWASGLGSSSGASNTGTSSGADSGFNWQNMMNQQPQQQQPQQNTYQEYLMRKQQRQLAEELLKMKYGETNGGY